MMPDPLEDALGIDAEPRIYDILALLRQRLSDVAGTLESHALHLEDCGFSEEVAGATRRAAVRYRQATLRLDELMTQDIGTQLKTLADVFGEIKEAK